MWKKNVKEVGTACREKFVVRSTSNLGHNFGLRVALVQADGPPKILEEKVFAVVFDKPELFPVYYRSFKNNHWPEKALWKLDISAESPEDEMYKIDSEPNISLFLNEDIIPFVNITSESAQRQKDTKLAHTATLNFVFLSAVQQLADWVFSEMQPDKNGSIPEETIADSVYKVLRERMSFNSNQELYDYWKLERHDMFPVKMQEVVSISNIYQRVEV